MPEFGPIPEEAMGVETSETPEAPDGRWGRTRAWAEQEKALAEEELRTSGPDALRQVGLSSRKSLFGALGAAMRTGEFLVGAFGRRANE